jgi:hypothetical protein
MEQRIIKIFTEALLNKDLAAIQDLLHPEGEFFYLNSDIRLFMLN